VVPALFGSDARRSAAALVLALLVLLGLIAVAEARQRDTAAPFGRLVQPKGEPGCVHERGTNRCATGRAVTSPEDIAISPDGRHAYVASFGSHAVAVFSRDRNTGRLTQLRGRRGCVRHERGGSCSPARALARPSAIAISPGGANVYVAAAGSDALAVFARNRRTGALRQLAGAKGCLSQRAGGGCLVGRALNEPTSVAVSPDGRHVYVAGRRFPSGVAVLTRAPDGSLTQPEGTAGCVSRGGGSGCAPARGISAPEEVAVSPDSRYVLVAGMRSNAVATLSQGPAGLSQAAGEAGCLAKDGAEGCMRGRSMAGPVDLAITPDGRDVYVASSISDGVAVVRRDRETGALTQSLSRAGCISQGGSGGRCRRGEGFDEVWSVALSPDGRNLYAVSPKVNMLAAVARNRSTGALRQLPGKWACFIRAGVRVGCPDGRGLTIAVSVTVSRDGRNVYVASDDLYLGAVAVFRRVGE
jgi:DNA-binding beta-propeller fold protein YncE